SSSTRRGLQWGDSVIVDDFMPKVMSWAEIPERKSYLREDGGFSGRHVTQHINEVVVIAARRMLRDELHARE
ncbi:hypothetical protein ACHZ98_23775, partial [Streptomyces sp. MAR4 CNY-716]